MKRKHTMTTAALAGVFGLIAGLAQAQIKIGHLVDYHSGSSDISQDFGEGESDAIAYINETGGIDGEKIEVETVDYNNHLSRILATYKRWAAGGKMAAILGWGMSDTEALMPFITKDQIPYISGSYAGALTDPTGRAERTEKPAPYNFFYGPSYSDAIRGLIQWAADDWKAKGRSEAPKYIHMGANHPYPNAAKAVGEDYAKHLGFDIVPPIRYTIVPGDFTPQCQALKESGANYAYMGNTAASNILLAKACEAAGVEVQFLGNVWSVDENFLKAAGSAGNGIVFALRVGALWGSDVPGMKLAREIAQRTTPSGSYRSLHYLVGICTAYYLKEAIEWAKQDGEINGLNIKKGFYHKENWTPAGLEGVCPGATWTQDDHRSTTAISVYKTSVSGPTDESLFNLMDKEVIKLKKLTTVELPRKPEWLGW